MSESPTTPDRTEESEQTVRPTPAADTTTARGKGPIWTGRRWAKPAAAGVGLVLIGGLGGFALGHSTAGGDDLAPTSFQPGRQGGQQGGQQGQQGGPRGSSGPQMGGGMGGSGEMPQQGQSGQSGGGSGSTSGDSTT